MGLAVTTVASGGLPVVEGGPSALAVTEVGIYGLAVTKVATGKPGLPVTFVTAGGVVVPPLVTATLDPATVLNTTLSGGNLVATSTTAVTPSGARTLPATAFTTGRYYFEIALTAFVAGASVGFGCATLAATYSALCTNAAGGTVLFVASGNIWSNGAVVGGMTLGARAAGNVIGVAADLGNRKQWFRVLPAGLWNGNAPADPATNAGGAVIPAGAQAPVLTFNTNGVVFTANFGATPFVGVVPAGFTRGWGS